MQNNLSFNRRIYLLLLLAFASFLYSPQKLQADGKIFPDIAYKIPPKIPSQKAIIVYKDGIEKLIIESSLDGQGKEFAWIVPLPTKPINFETVSPGLIKTLSFAIQPKITHDIMRYLDFCFFLTVLITLWFATALSKK